MASDPLAERKHMGADAFIGFYGIEETIPAEADMTALEDRTDDRIVRARKNKLDVWWGRVTDGRDYHLLIGKNIADLGAEGAEGSTITNGDFADLQEDVKRRLTVAGFTEEPKLIFKFESQY
jgi:hypothetical protein